MSTQLSHLPDNDNQKVTCYPMLQEANGQADQTSSSEFEARPVNLQLPDMVEWSLLANLMQLKRLTLELGALLLETGVTSLNQLADCIPENLHQRLSEANSKTKILSRPPMFDEVMEIIITARISS